MAQLINPDSIKANNAVQSVNRGNVNDNQNRIFLAI